MAGQVEEVSRNSLATLIELRPTGEGDLEACTHGECFEPNWGE